MRGTPHVCRLYDKISDYLALDAEIVLIGIRGTQVWIDKEDTANPERRKTCGYKIEVLGRWLRGKRISNSRRYERLTQIVDLYLRIRCKRVESETGGPEERRLSVELEIIFSF